MEEDEGLKAVHEAFNSGINYFDTSPWYGELRAEIVRPQPPVPASASSNTFMPVLSDEHHWTAETR